MIFCHFISRGAPERILNEGLNRGEAPIRERKVVNAVNLTTDQAKTWWLYFGTVAPDLLTSLEHLSAPSDDVQTTKEG